LRLTIFQVGVKREWDGKGDGRMRPYCGFELTQRDNRRWDLRVWSGRGNYDGGDNSIENADKDTCIAMIKDWCSEMLVESK
jgi:hypothetical protein